MVLLMKEKTKIFHPSLLVAIEDRNIRQNIVLDDHTKQAGHHKDQKISLRDKNACIQGALYI